MSEQPGEPDEPEQEVPDLEAILRAAQGIGPDIPAAIRAQAAIHAEWRQAWLDTGKFSEQESFELIGILVCVSAGGLGSMRLSWLPEGRTSLRRPESLAGMVSPGRSARTGIGALSLHTAILI